MEIPMSKSCFHAFLVFHALAVPAFAQEAQKPQEPAKRLPLAVMKAWENAEKKVQKAREIYDNANAKALEGFQREIEKIKPAVNVEEVVRQFQQEAIVALDANAKAPAPPPPDNNIVVFNGHRYRLVEEHLSWDDAKKRCEEMGGHLLVIDDRNEQEFIQSALRKFREANQKLPEGTDVWMGLYKNKEKKWMAVTGKEQVYTKWYVLEPRDWFTHTRFSIVHESWITGEPTRKEKTFFICEWEQ